MKGLEISKRYYEEYGREMIAKEFPGYEDRIAVGLAGPGSDCFGFDDEISTDHDSGAGFCMWLTDSDYEEIGFSLSRAYSRLPDEIDGIKRGGAPLFGSGHFGAMKISDFFLPLTGTAGAPETREQWLFTPDYSLAAAVNGEVFRDDLGIFSGIRQKIMRDMPMDVRLKKISARVIGMAQSGQYNFPRCISHGETGAASLALAEFVKETAMLVYLLNGRYAPFYKWMLRGMKDLPIFPELSGELETLITRETSAESAGVIEDICRRVGRYLCEIGLTTSQLDFLEPYAYEIRDKIKDSRIRNMHIMEG